MRRKSDDRDRKKPEAARAKRAPGQADWSYQTAGKYVEKSAWNPRIALVWPLLGVQSPILTPSTQDSSTGAQSVPSNSWVAQVKPVFPLVRWVHCDGGLCSHPFAGDDGGKSEAPARHQAKVALFAALTGEEQKPFSSGRATQSAPEGLLASRNTTFPP